MITVDFLNLPRVKGVLMLSLMSRIILRILLRLRSLPRYLDDKDDSSIDVQAKGFGTDNKETLNTLNSVLNSPQLIFHSLLSVG
jgi:hypothetical protein